MERKLAAIMAADVADYSLLMNTDEDATYQAWRSARAEVVDPCIAGFNGRIVKHTGDGFLAEFPTVLDAVECATEIQERMANEHKLFVNERQFQFRIGINLGDIIVDHEDIHGDGVNIAARLEGLAQAGGVCISSDVFRQVRNKKGFCFQDKGARRVKNIRDAIQVYSVRRGGADTEAPVPVEAPKNDIEGLLSTINVPDYKTNPVFGRDKEESILSQAYDKACDKQGNMVLIRGEPGIGKSCLARTFAQKCRQSGAWVVYGQCHETLGSPPFWPWLQVLKVLDAMSDKETVDFTALFDRLAENESESQHTISSTFAREVGSEQFVIFNQICSMIAEIASTNTLVILLDDLHWADKSSLLLLAHLCTELSGQSILLLGTYRDTEVTRKHPLSQTLGDINRVAKLERIGLKGLSIEGVIEFLSSVIDFDLPHELIQALYEKTEGNPLFLCEVANILQQQNANSAHGQWQLEIPDGIAEAIGRRLDLLSEPCNELLSVASVVGRQFNMQTLLGLDADFDQLVTLALLEEAEDKGIIRASDASLGDYQFSHVLIRDILYDELSLTKKILLHAKVADVLVDQKGKGHEQSIGEIARHYYQSLQSGQGDKALEYSLLAADHARSLSAFDEARNYYEMALDIINIGEDNQAKMKPKILLEISYCLQALGCSTDIHLKELKRCLDEARIQKNYKVFADAACRKVYVGRSHHQYRDALTTIDEALSYVCEEDLIVRANVLAHRAMALAFNLRRREAEQVAYESVEVAAKSGDPRTHCSALCMVLMVLRGRPEKLSERIRLGQQALALAKKCSNDYLGMDPLEWLILSSQEAGEINQAQKYIAQLDIIVLSSYRFKARYFAAGAKACLALFKGKWEQAEALIEQALEIGTGRLDGGADGVYGAQMFILNRELGRLPMIHAALTKMAAGDLLMWKPGLLATYTDLGMNEECRLLIDEMALDDFSQLANDELYLTSLVYLCEACNQLRYVDMANSLYQRLLPYSGQMVAHPTAVCYGPADLYLGMLSGLMKKMGEAEDHLSRAWDLCEKAGPTMWQPHVKFRHAQILLHYDYHSKSINPKTLIREARELAKKMRMVNVLAKIDLLDNAQNNNRNTFTDDLTPRELEVLGLIVQGKSNKLIASELNRSLATVATHVRAILSKTHAANRTEAAAVAIEHDLFG